MRVLLDTHALLWWLAAAPELSRAAVQVIENPSNQLLVSAASAWEIATKVRIGKLPSGKPLALDFNGVMERERFQLLPISVEHAVRAGLIPIEHRDPFDRMLIAQALTENVPLVTSETGFERFGVNRIW